MNAEKENLDFVTIKGLIRYGEALAQRSHMEGIELPPTPPSTEDRPRQAEEAMAALGEAADGGDMQAIGAAFMNVGKACNGCHERFRVEHD